MTTGNTRQWACHTPACCRRELRGWGQGGFWVRGCAIFACMHACMPTPVWAVARWARRAWCARAGGLGAFNPHYRGNGFGAAPPLECARRATLLTRAAKLRYHTTVPCINCRRPGRPLRTQPGRGLRRWCFACCGGTAAAVAKRAQLERWLGRHGCSSGVVCRAGAVAWQARLQQWRSVQGWSSGACCGSDGARGGW